MDEWITIFRSGAHVDASGQERVYTDADLDAIVEKYNGQNQHEAPVVIGHPKDNAPAWAWVESLKRDGENLLMKMRDMQSEFSEMLKKRLFKKRSISLYPDLTLRHVGFLGAMPPAVKGLPDFAYKEDLRAMEYEFSEFDKWQFRRIGNLFRRLREFLIESEGLEKVDAVLPGFDVNDL